MLQGTIFKANFLILPLGTSDMVLGVHWLCTLGGSTDGVKFNFRRLTMEFEYEDKMMMLQGIEPKLKVVDAATLQKASSNGGQLFMIIVNSVEDQGRGYHIEEQEKQEPVEISAVLREYNKVFEQPRGLPPS